MFFRSVVYVAALFGLTACGGGGGGGGESLGNPIDLSNYPNASYDDLATAVPYLAGYVGSDPLNVNDLPKTEDTLTYYGAMLLGEDLSDGTTKDGYVGQVKLDVNFSNQTIGGTATNFYETGLNTGGDNGGNPDGTEIDGPFRGPDNSLNLKHHDTWSDNKFSLAVDGTLDGMDINGIIDDGSFRSTQRVDGTVGVYAVCNDNCLDAGIGNPPLDAAIAAD